jgi:uncharacterized protein YecT (DUF1311 family)
MKQLLLSVTFAFLASCSEGNATPSEDQKILVSEAAKNDCIGFGLNSMRMNCEKESKAQPTIDQANKHMEKLLTSLQAKMQKADADWSKGSIDDSDPKYVDALNSAQKTWEEHATKTCLFDSFRARGGTDQSHELWKCNLKHLEARVLQLEEWDK